MQIDKNLPSIFGLAAIQNQLVLTGVTKQLCTQLGIDENAVLKNESYISYRGEFFQYLAIGKLRLTYPGVYSKIHFGRYRYSVLDKFDEKIYSKVMSRLKKF